MPVDVAVPLQARIVDWDEYTGRFEAAERVELRARVSGYLEEIRFDDGTIVEKGQPLFIIDKRAFEAAYARAEAELKSAEAERTLAETEFNRTQSLVNNGTISMSVLEERIAAKLRAEAQVAVAEAVLSQAALDLDYAEVAAPFTGRISDSPIDTGNLVAAGETVLATIVSTDPIHLVFTASEADYLRYSRLHLGPDGAGAATPPANPVYARLIDEDGWPHQGRVDFVANELDPNTGTIKVRAIFDNAAAVLTPGLFARLRVTASVEYDALLVPDEAVISDQDRKVLLVTDAEGTVTAHVVELGPLYRGLRVIRSGIEAGDRVIVSGVQRARPGGKVVPEETKLEYPEPAPDLAAN